MGENGAARVDAALLLEVARQYQAVADTIDDVVRTHLTGLAFDGASAGRAYTAHGDAVRLRLNDLAGGLSQWARASAEVAVALRTSADRYADADSRAASRVG